MVFEVLLDWSCVRVGENFIIVAVLDGGILNWFRCVGSRKRVGKSRSH